MSRENKGSRHLLTVSSVTMWWQGSVDHHDRDRQMRHGNDGSIGIRRIRSMLPFIEDNPWWALKINAHKRSRQAHPTSIEAYDKFVAKSDKATSADSHYLEQLNN
jgi:hypothetical protein